MRRGSLGRDARVTHSRPREIAQEGEHEKVCCRRSGTAGIQRSNHPVELREFIDGAIDEALQSRPGPADWSVVDIVRHLGDVEEMRHVRLDRILAEDNPLMERATLQPGERDRDDAKVLLQRWERLRTRALERLSAMSDEQWRRIGTQAPDPHVGRVTPFVTDVLDQAVRINEHSGDHLGHIWKNLAMFRLRRSRKRVRRRLVDVWGTCPLERALPSRRGRTLCYRISESRGRLDSRAHASGMFRTTSRLAARGDGRSRSVGVAGPLDWLDKETRVRRR